MMDLSEYRADASSHLPYSLKVENPRHVQGVPTVRCTGLNTYTQVCTISIRPAHESMSTCTHHSIGEDPSSSNVAFALKNNDLS